MKFRKFFTLFFIVYYFDLIASQAYYNSFSPSTHPSQFNPIYPPQKSFPFQAHQQQAFQSKPKPALFAPKRQQSQQNKLHNQQPLLAPVNYQYPFKHQYPHLIPSLTKNTESDIYKNYQSVDFNQNNQFQPKPQHINNQKYRSFSQQFSSRRGLFKLDVDDKEEVPIAQCGYLKPKITNYVSNGESTSHNLWPWYVQITISSDMGSREASETYCGGTLISENYILTAAHCFDEQDESQRAQNTVVTMRGVNPSAKSSRGKKKKLKKSKDSSMVFKAIEVILHNEYVPAMSDNEAALKGQMPGPKHDIALIKFDTGEHDIKNKLMPACLPDKGHQIAVNAKCKIMGHGFMNSNDEDNFIMPNLLQMADVSISANSACKDEVDSDSIKHKINSDTVCIRGPIHPCVGDSGGPLLCKGESSDVITGDKDESEESDEDEDPSKSRWFLVGVTSFAVSTDENDRCGHFKSAVFGKVSSYVDWINKNTKQS